MSSSDATATGYPTKEVMGTCADMNLANAIEDMAYYEGISKAEARDRMITSPLYECLYNFDSKLWMEGPDYLRYFYTQCEGARVAQAG